MKGRKGQAALPNLGAGHRAPASIPRLRRGATRLPDSRTKAGITSKLSTGGGRDPSPRRLSARCRLTSTSRRPDVLSQFALPPSQLLRKWSSVIPTLQPRHGAVGASGSDLQGVRGAASRWPRHRLSCHRRFQSAPVRPRPLAAPHAPRSLSSRLVAAVDSFDGRLAPSCLMRLRSYTITPWARETVRLSTAAGRPAARRPRDLSDT